MDLVDMTHNERIAMMRKRYAHFCELVKKYTSFEDFIQDMDEKLALWGIGLDESDDWLTLYIALDYSEYEEYHVIMGDDGHLTMSKGVYWQDDYCCNSLINIFTDDYIDEEDICKLR